MARPGQRISKRAQHKLDVAARKDQPFVKRRKQRRNALPFPSGFFAMSRECEREGVLMTRVDRKPPSWMLEHMDANGAIIKGVLRDAKPGNRGYDLLLEGGGLHMFKTRRQALQFFSRLQRVEPEPVNVPHVVTPEESNDSA